MSSYGEPSAARRRNIRTVSTGKLVLAAINESSSMRSSKLTDYAAIGVKYYAVYDPEKRLGGRLLRLHELHGTSYVERTGLWMPGIGLELFLWEGIYERLPAQWLRWCDAQGEPIGTGAERAEQERRRPSRSGSALTRSANGPTKSIDKPTKRLDQARPRYDRYSRTGS